MWQKIKNYYHLAQALCSDLIYGFPSKKLTVIGVTGTDGKTTTVSMISHILKAANKKVSMINSISAQIGNRQYDTGFHVSTPSPFQVQKYLKHAVKNGSQYFVLEATSHGLDQNRLAFVDFKVAVLTHITHEHLDYHKTWDQYAYSKLKLFKNAQTSIINSDDDKSYQFIKARVKGKILTYSQKKYADFNLDNFRIKLKIDGDYNLQNAMAAAAAASSLGIPKQTILKALASFSGVLGRMENIDLGQDFLVFVDFAHTPNGLENALATLRSKVSPGSRVIAVFGSAGERDKAKRIMMGRVADKLADLIVLTSEDPRSEDPQKICREIARGIKNKKYHIIIDRQEAIDYAISKAKGSDVVGFFGKAHEKSMNIGGKESPWDEFEAARETIKRRLNAK